MHITKNFLGTSDRGARIRLRWIEHYQGSQNVAATCRYFGISRTTFYRWLSRYEKFGEKGLAELTRRPHKLNYHFPQHVRDLILQIRQERDYGHHRMSLYLAKRHQIYISPVSIWRIFKAYKVTQMPKRKTRWVRYPQKPLNPGEKVQVDVKFVPKFGENKQKYYQFTAIDESTRFRVLRIYDQNSQTSAMDFVSRLAKQLPFAIRKIQTDNGNEFGMNFTWHLADLGITHRKIRPGKPEENGKVERSHKTDTQEFYEREIFQDVKILIRKLRDWEQEYNYYRPHMALGGQTPYEYLQKKLPTIQQLALKQAVT